MAEIRGERGGMLVILGIVAFLSLSYGIVGGFLDVDSKGWLWDTEVYEATAERWHTGSNPYIADGSTTSYFLAVTATPLLARVFHDFEAKLLYSLLAVWATAGALLLSVRAAGPLPSATLLCWLYVIAFANAEVFYLIASGNLTWLASLVAAAALLTASRGQWTRFYIFVGVASLLKPYFLALLIVPFALGALSPGVVLALLPSVADVIVSGVLWPAIAVSRLEGIWNGIIMPLQLRKSLAGQLSRLLAELDLNPATATVLAVVFQLSVALALVMLLRRRGPSQPRLAFAIAVVAAFAAVPRQSGYDAFVFGPAIFVAFFPGLKGGVPPLFAITCLLTLVAGLFKDDLAFLPLLALAAAWLSPLPLSEGADQAVIPRAAEVSLN